MNNDLNDLFNLNSGQESIAVAHGGSSGEAAVQRLREGVKLKHPQTHQDTQHTLTNTHSPDQEDPDNFTIAQNNFSNGVSFDMPNGISSFLRASDGTEGTERVEAGISVGGAAQPFPSKHVRGATVQLPSGAGGSRGFTRRLKDIFPPKPDLGSLSARKTEAENRKTMLTFVERNKAQLVLGSQGAIQGSRKSALAAQLPDFHEQVALLRMKNVSKCESESYSIQTTSRQTKTKHRQNTLTQEFAPDHGYEQTLTNDHHQLDQGVNQASGDHEAMLQQHSKHRWVEREQMRTIDGVFHQQLEAVHQLPRLISSQLNDMERYRQKKNASAQQHYQTNFAIRRPGGLQTPLAGQRSRVEHRTQQASRAGAGARGNRTSLGNYGSQHGQSDYTCSSLAEPTDQLGDLSALARSNRKMRQLHQASEEASSKLAFKRNPERTGIPIPLQSVPFRNVSRAIKRRLEQSQLAVFAEPNLKQQELAGYKDLCHEVTINLRAEYLHHLECMQELDKFESMATEWDHTFYRSIVRPFFDTQAREQEQRLQKKYHPEVDEKHPVSARRAEEHSQSSKRSHQSSLSLVQEHMIPAQPVSMTQNKKMVGLWYEAKKILDEERKRKKFATSEEVEECTDVRHLKKFFSTCLKAFERWLKVECEEEGNVASALTVDLLMKAMIIKLDEVLSIKDRQTNECKTTSVAKVHETIQNCQESLEAEKTKAVIDIQQLTKQIEELTKLNQSQSKQIDRLQRISNEKGCIIDEISKSDHRVEYLASLDAKYKGMNNLLLEHDLFRKKQQTLVKEYTRMVDIGITPMLKIERGCQTDLSLMSLVPSDCKNVADYCPTDTEIVSELYLPLVAACANPKIAKGASEQHEGEALYTPKEFRDLCEKVLNRQPLGQTHTTKRSHSRRQKNSDLAVVTEIEMSQKYFQERIINHFIQDDEASNHVSVPENCLKFLRTLARQEEAGSLYAGMISKVFGFKQVPNYINVVQSFLTEREKYLGFCAKPPSGGNDQQKLPETSGSPEPVDEKSEQMPKETTAQKLDASQNESKMNEIGSPTPADKPDEDANQLSLLSVYDFIVQHYPGPDSLGSTIWSQVLDTLNSESAQSSILDQIYSPLDVPSNTHSTAVVENCTQDQDNDLTQVQGTLSPALLHAFSKAMLSLFIQSGSHPRDIIDALQNYANHNRLSSSPRFTMAEFTSALQLKYILQKADVEAIFQFLNSTATEEGQFLDIIGFQGLLVSSKLRDAAEEASMCADRVLYGILEGIMQYYQSQRQKFVEQLHNTAVSMMLDAGREQTKAKHAHPKGKSRTINHGETSPQVPLPDDKAIFEHISQFDNFRKCLKEAVPSLEAEELLMIYRRLIPQLLAFDEIQHESTFGEIADAIFSRYDEQLSRFLDV